MKLRVGIVGLGDQWQTRHLPALRALADRFEIRAVCSQVAERAVAVAKEFDADAAGGFRAVVEREDIDVVLALAPDCLLYTSPSPRDKRQSRMPSSA